MKALQFKINLETLELKNWTEWLNAPEDCEYILDCSKGNNLKWFGNTKEDCVVFQGTPQDLFWFLKDVAYRYDIELI